MTARAAVITAVIAATLCATSQASPRLTLVDLEMLAPTPRSRSVPDTGMVRMRTAPPDGIRELDDDVAVSATCGDRYCVDGLVDQHARRVLVPAELHADDRRILAAGDGTVQRVIKLAHVDDRLISIYLGDSIYSGGVHHNQSLACATFDRRTRARVGLAQVTSPDRARRLLDEARAAVASYRGSQDYAADAHSFRITPADIVLCAPGKPPSDGTVVEIAFPR